MGWANSSFSILSLNFSAHPRARSLCGNAAAVVGTDVRPWHRYICLWLQDSGIGKNIAVFGSENSWKVQRVVAFRKTGWQRKSARCWFSGHCITRASFVESVEGSRRALWISSWVNPSWFHVKHGHSAGALRVPQCSPRSSAVDGDSDRKSVHRSSIR